LAGYTNNHFTAIDIHRDRSAFCTANVFRIDNHAIFSQLFSNSSDISYSDIWDQGKLIRFPQVEQLVDFLKKVA